MSESTNKKRKTFVAWMLFPLLLTLFSVNYLIELTRPSDWEVFENLTREPEVLSAADQFQPFEPLDWKGQGLVTIWFDDAWYSQYMPTYQIMEEYGFKGTIAVPTEMVGYEDYLNWTQIKRLRFEGWEIVAHSRTHSCLGEFSREQSENEAKGSLEDLRKRGINAHVYVYPCGIVTPELEEAVRENFRAARKVDWGLTPLPLKDKYDIRVLEINPGTKVEEVQEMLYQAKVKRMWMGLMFHQIDASGAEYSATQEQLAEILEAIKQSGLQVVVPSQVIEL